jgi:hypothetical protein
MKKSRIIDAAFLLLLAIILIVLNESQIVSLANYKYLYIVIIAAYFFGRATSNLFNKRNRETF